MSALIREQILRRAPRCDRDFRWRGGDVSRIEGLSDAVFAFAVTLLVVSLEVPATFTDLLAAMREFVAFAVCFTLLAWIWFQHYLFFRRYGFQDRLTIVLNMILLFVVLFYIYPLKFLFTMIMNQLIGVGTPAGGVKVIRTADTPALMIIYSVGFVAVFILFFLLYLHAYRQRHALGLNELETAHTRFSLQAQIVHVAIGLVSIAMAAVGGPPFAPWAGLIYALIGPCRYVHGLTAGREIDRLRLTGRFTPDGG